MKTAPKYRMHDIGGVHPGMYEVEKDGVAVSGELYTLPIDVLLRVIENEPPGLYRGPVELADGRIVPGVLYDAAMAKKHPVIESGNWRDHMQP
jgi:AGZA family xanthine/uracil permease-like MFS transporter